MTTITWTTAELQAEVNDCWQAGGGIVELPPGEFILTEPLALQPGVWLRGSGPQTVLKAADGWPYPVIVGSGYAPRSVIGVSDLTLDGNAAHTQPGAGIGLQLQSVDPGSFIRNVVFRQTRRSAVIIGSTTGRSVGVRVQDCFFTSCGSIAETLDNMAIGIVNAVDVIVSGNVIQDSPLAVDCEMHPGMEDLLYNLLITGNIIRTSVSLPAPCGWAVQVLGQPGRPAQHVVIRGNSLIGPNERKYLFEHAEHVTIG